VTLFTISWSITVETRTLKRYITVGHNTAVETASRLLRENAQKSVDC